MGRSHFARKAAISCPKLVVRHKCAGVYYTLPGSDDAIHIINYIVDLTAIDSTRDIELL